jgi:hypothetical protein
VKVLGRRLSGSRHDPALAALVVSSLPLKDRGFVAAISPAPAERALDAAILEFVQVAVRADVRFVIAVTSGSGLSSRPIHGGQNLYADLASAFDRSCCLSFP